MDGYNKASAQSGGASSSAARWRNAKAVPDSHKLLPRPLRCEFGKFLCDEKPPDYEMSGEPLCACQAAALYRRVAAASGGKVRPQAFGRVQELSLSGSELEEAPPGGGQSGASPGRAIPTSGLHRQEPEFAQPGGSAVLQQAWYGGAVDQGRQAGGKDDMAVVSSVPGQRSALAVKRAGLQSGQSVAAPGAAEENRPLLADELAATVGEDGRAVGETRPVLLAPVS